MKDENIHIKIELCKDKDSGKIALGVHFDEKAPNFTMENNECFWTPTNEEKNILNEAFDLVIAGMKYKTQSGNNKNDQDFTLSSVTRESEIKTKPIDEIIQNPKETEKIEKQVFATIGEKDKDVVPSTPVFEEKTKKGLNEDINENPKKVEKIEKQVFRMEKEDVPSFEKDAAITEPGLGEKPGEGLKEEIMGNLIQLKVH